LLPSRTSSGITNEDLLADRSLTYPIVVVVVGGGGVGVFVVVEGQGGILP